jgi:hypothetical protein
MPNAIDIAAKAISEDKDVYEAIADHYDITLAEAKQLFKDTIQKLIETH